MAVPAQVVEGQHTANALSLIENMNVAAIQATMNKISQFQAVVKGTLKEGHDYGVIPGTGDKPTLKKPGAEKILMLMGLTSEYEIIERVQDYDAGFFAFTVRCKLSHNGMLITEGVGHANTKERRYTSVKKGKEPQDPYTLANTVLKMAKKRAQVDAALTVASLSDIFTQDIEDMVVYNEGHQTQSRSNNNSTSVPKATDRQLNFIGKKATEKGISDAELNAFCQAQIGKNVDELSKKEASDLINALDSYQPPEPAATAEREDPFAPDDEPFDFTEDDLPI